MIAIMYTVLTVTLFILLYFLFGGTGNGSARSIRIPVPFCSHDMAVRILDPVLGWWGGTTQARLGR